MIPFTLSWTVLVESHGSLNISRAILGPRGFHVIPCSGDPSAWLVGGEIFFFPAWLVGSGVPVYRFCCSERYCVMDQRFHFANYHTILCD
jgi:hypothetical protein